MQQITEIWKPVEGFENFYEISNLGRVKKLWEGRSHNIPKGIMNVKINNSGYRYAFLCNNEGKQQSILVHRLVAYAFIPNTENKPQVNHINGVKLDNRLDNLEWATNSENQLHAYKIGLQFKETGEGNPLFGRRVRREGNWMLSLSKRVIHKETGKIYESIAEAAIQTGIKYYTIGRSLRGAIKKDLGFAYAADN